MKLKKITLEIPEETYLIDITYYHRVGEGISKANGVFSEAVLFDGSIIKAWSNNYAVTQEVEYSE